MRVERRNLLLLVLIGLYILIGTIDKLNDLFIEKSVTGYLCTDSDGLCNLLLMYLYMPSYAIGTILSMFLGGGTIAFIISQVFLLFICLIIVYFILRMLGSDTISN